MTASVFRVLGRGHGQRRRLRRTNEHRRRCTAEHNGPGTGGEPQITGYKLLRVVGAGAYGTVLLAGQPHLVEHGVRLEEIDPG